MTSRILIPLLAVLALAGTSFWWFRQVPSHTASTGPVAARKPLYWYDPMMPDQHFDAPGKSPFMDMQLVPKYADDEAPAAAPAPEPAPAAAERKPLYWYDPMVPDQHFDAPGKSPFMDMQLVPKYADDEAPAAAPAPAPAPAATERKPLYWYDPMVPDQHFDAPGKSPFMDMQLVPKYADDEAPARADASASASAPGTPAGLRIDPRVQQNLGLRLAPVERQRLSRQLRAVGAVAVDEHRIEAVQVRAEGWLERLAVRAVGDPVKRGALLASVYSPELLAAQEELLLAQRSGDAGLREAARLRLSRFGLSDAQVSRVLASGRAERRVDYHAPFDGYVMALGAREGAAVAPGLTLFQLAALDTVWVEVAVPEAQAAWLRTGDAAVVELASAPGEQRRGKVDYVYPELDVATRSLRLRVQVDNRGLLLRPGMFASVSIATAARAEALTVPSEAVIRTGLRSLVLVAEPGDRFRPVVVQLGMEADERSEVLAGLKAGEQVVASGQFLIDSEASLRAALDRLAPTLPDTATTEAQP